MSTAILVQGLNCTYPGKTVLNKISFEVAREEFFIVIGPNGSGKSTLIKALAGLISPSDGNIFIHDRPLHKIKPKALSRQVAYVPQTVSEETPFTIRETVLLGRAPYLGILGVEGPNDLTIARQAMCFTGVDHLADRPMTRLSGGERQRAHIARAICQEPDLILLDEPTAALDLAHQVRTMDLMTTLKRERKTTVVMVSHDINLAAMYADRLLLIVDGQKVACGPPDQVIREEILGEAYGCRVMVDRSPAGNWPRICLVKDAEACFEDQ